MLTTPDDDKLTYLDTTNKLEHPQNAHHASDNPAGAKLSESNRDESLNEDATQQGQALPKGQHERNPRDRTRGQNPEGEQHIGNGRRGGGGPGWRRHNDGGEQ